MIRVSPALLIAASLSLQAGTPLTLPAALREAGRASFQAESAQFSEAVSREETAQVKALYFPELNAGLGHLALDHTRELQTSPITASVLGQTLTVPGMAMGIEPSSSWRYKVGLQYLVYDFGRRGKALAAARSKEEATSAAGRAGVRRLQAEVAARYMGLLEAKARKRVLAQRRIALQDHLKTVQDLLKQGIVARNDYLRTEVALRGVEDADGAVDAAYASALEALNLGLGRDPKAPAELPDALDAPPSLPWDETAVRLRAVQGNESVRALQAKVKALEEQTALRRADLLPSVVAEAAHTYEENRFLVHPHENSLMVGLTWKVLDGGARAARITQGATEAAQARRELLEAQRTAEAAAVAALRDFQQALREVETARKNVAAAEENLRIVEDQYREGMVRSTDALDAEAVLAESRSSLSGRHYKAYTEQAALLAILGEDLAEFYETHLEK